MALFTDQTGYSISLHEIPQRIISVVPSQTELLASLGLSDEVIGITKFCVHPSAWFRTKERVGGTKNIHLEQVIALQPDLVIAGKEENLRDQIETLRLQVPVWTSDVTDLPSALDMIRQVGNLTGTSAQAAQLADDITAAFNSLVPLQQPLKVLYLIWKKPYMSVGRDTFINAMLAACGLKSVTAQLTRYPEIQPEDIHGLKPDLIFLSSEPYPFKEKDLAELQDLFPSTHIRLVDGEFFSWYGSRLLSAADYFSNLIRELEANK